MRRRRSGENSPRVRERRVRSLLFPEKAGEEYFTPFAPRILASRQALAGLMPPCPGVSIVRKRREPLRVHLSARALYCRSQEKRTPRERMHRRDGRRTARERFAEKGIVYVEQVRRRS